ncbi:ankyrin repeat domain-containing protein [Pedobacter metabolipauper]|uniref:Ankyrin repeat protein n=1 Tax=Pedobacter metabolipauper TaxID=425513 RepID=A0A4R6SX81_9SPHI|nr:ankyrin repeat domain-containing protein [Pedobacter metabolipauper]TDQ09773.1 ankyrin repeat protein [Pedobacter metabolipauper]
MKKLLTAIFALSSLIASAQQNTLLDASFWQGKPDMSQIKTEVEKGNNPSQFNSSSFDPVVLAINAGASTEAVKYLLSQPGNDIAKLTHDSRIYLHWAASKGNVELVEYLLSKGSKTNAVDSHGSTPLLFAASGGQQNTKIYDLFIAHGADLKKDLSQDGANVLLLAIPNDKDFVLTNYFISKGLDINSSDASGNNSFSYAARSGNIELLKTLLQKGVKANPNAMLMAAQGSRRGANTIEVYQYLESLNIKPNSIGKNGENALHAIVRKPKQEDIIQYFLSKGADVNQVDEEGNTVIMNAAAANRDTAVIGMLISRVKNINQANQKGETALTMAVRSSSPEVVSYLISKGASAKALDKKGNNLAYYVVDSYRPQSAQGANPQAARPAPNGPKPEDLDTKIKILQNAGLNVTAAQADGNTLYHIAVAKNDVSLIKRLQPLNIDINAKNKDGLTALHKAALVSKDDVLLKYLLSIGAKKDAVTNFKETAFDLASENESLTKNNVSVNFLK